MLASIETGSDGSDGVRELSSAELAIVSGGDDQITLPQITFINGPGLSYLLTIFEGPDWMFGFRSIAAPGKVDLYDPTKAYG